MDPPPTTSNTFPETPRGGIGTQKTGRSLTTPTAAASEAGGPPPDTPEQPYARSPPPLGWGGGWRGGTTSDTVEQPCRETPATDFAAGYRNRVEEWDPPPPQSSKT